MTWYLLEERIAQYAESRAQAQPGASLVEMALENGDTSLALAGVMLVDE